MFLRFVLSDGLLEMKLLFILGATSASLWLLHAVSALNVSRSLRLYAFWMFVIAALASFVATKIPRSDASYAIFYAVMLGPLVLFTTGTAVQFALNLGMHGLKGFVLIALLAAWFVRLFRDQVPDNLVSKVMLTQGYFFLVCGILTLASAVPLTSALGFRLRIALGTYWTVVSVYSFSHSLGAVRAKELWISLGDWVANAMCILFLGGLALWLSGAQPEASRQPIRGMQVAHSLDWEEVR